MSKYRYYALFEPVAPNVKHFCDVMSSINKKEAIKEARRRGWKMTKHMKVEEIDARTLKTMKDSYRLEIDRLSVKIANIMRYI